MWGKQGHLLLFVFISFLKKNTTDAWAKTVRIPTPLFFSYQSRPNIDIYIYTLSTSVQWWMAFPCERLPLFSPCDGLSLALVVLPPAVCSTLTAWKGKAAWSLASAGDLPARSLCVHFKDLVTSRRHRYPDKNPQLQSYKFFFSLVILSLLPFGL